MLSFLLGGDDPRAETVYLSPSTGLSKCLSMNGLCPECPASGCLVPDAVLTCRNQVPALSVFSSAQEKSLLWAVTRVGNTEATSVVLLRRSSCMRKGMPSELRAQGCQRAQLWGCSGSRSSPAVSLSPDHHVCLKHSSSTLCCLPQGHQGVLGGQLAKRIGEDVTGKGGSLGTHRPSCCRPNTHHGGPSVSNQPRLGG